jgi:hypothetical protein
MKDKDDLERIEEIKEMARSYHSNIKESIDSLTTLAWIRAYTYIGNCLFCEDRYPSLFVYSQPGREHFYCSNCKKCGDHKYFVKLFFKVYG